MKLFVNGSLSSVSSAFQSKSILPFLDMDIFSEAYIDEISLLESNDLCLLQDEGSHVVRLDGDSSDCSISATCSYSLMLKTPSDMFQLDVCTIQVTGSSDDGGIPHVDVEYTWKNCRNMTGSTVLTDFNCFRSV